MLRINTSYCLQNDVQRQATSKSTDKFPNSTSSLDLSNKQIIVTWIMIYIQILNTKLQSHLFLTMAITTPQHTSPKTKVIYQIKQNTI